MENVKTESVNGNEKKNFHEFHEFILQQKPANEGIETVLFTS